MRTHEEIDERSLAMARKIVARIDGDPTHQGLEKARSVCKRWSENRNEPAIAEWLKILEQPWIEIREILLDASEEGKRLRQSDPFCGILTREERWEIYRQYQRKTG